MGSEGGLWCNTPPLVILGLVPRTHSAPRTPRGMGSRHKAGNDYGGGSEKEMTTEVNAEDKVGAATVRRRQVLLSQPS